MTKSQEYLKRRKEIMFEAKYGNALALVSSFALVVFLLTIWVIANNL